MAHQVVWLQAALDDLDAIAAYIAGDSPVYASAVVARVLERAREAGQLPLAGKRLPEWDDDSIRERVVYRYRLIYQVLEDTVVILAVIHGARLLPDDLRGRAD